MHDEPESIDRVSPEESLSSIRSEPSEAGGTGELIVALEANVRELSDLVGRRLREEAQSRAAFERLHREMLDYKENFLQRAQEPLYRSLVRLVDDLDAMQDTEGSGLAFVRDQVLEILSRQGVEPFVCADEAYDATRQKAERSEPVASPADHRRVLKRLRPGYRIDERTLRPESVVIGVYRTPVSGGA